MKNDFTLADRASTIDLQAYLTRAKRLDPAGMVRVRAFGKVLACYVAPIFAGSLMEQGPTVLGLRTSEILEDAEVDIVAPITAVLDRLAALVAVLVEADALILLSDVDSLYDMPPTKPGAKRIETVAFGSELEDVEIGGSGSAVGTGGAVTKVSAAKVATEQGVAVLLTSSDLVSEALQGNNVGTWFEAKG